ncbi:hypothetical protein U9M48_008203 [Paspalum notatum var. saurae]|uniref:Reverse transcriptase Ty1/copia-type domain-containing protein n=1 Tax=Paspalum notatum var. saurae TaxID=547442 RepID=A0AAQ3WD03_PASNO
MDSIMSNRTWEVVECPYRCQPIGCKRVFKKKLRPDDTIDRYKARLVIKGYSLKKASHGLLVHQKDVKTTFLNGELDEGIYMDQLAGFVANGQEGKVCKLLKSLYGLKQFVSNPGNDHWCALERVLCYFKGTTNYDIRYIEYPRVLNGYRDANWISDADELYATSGYVLLLGGGAVSWKSCNQTILTRSIMEAKLTTLHTIS